MHREQDPQTPAGASPGAVESGAAEVLSQAPAVVFWKLLEYLGLLLFVVYVPRAMGPELYGELAVLMSTIGLLVLVSGLGAQPTFGRFIPEHMAAGDLASVRVLFSQILLTRVATGLLLGFAFVIAFPRLMPTAPPMVVLAGAATVAVSPVAATCYELFYGLNILGRWLAREGLGRLVLFALLLAFGGLGNLEGAGAALLVTQLVFLGMGIAWSRNYFALGAAIQRRSIWPSNLSFGLAFFGANLLMLAVWRLGEVMIQLHSGKPEEVAFFHLATALTLTAVSLLGQLNALLGPSLARLYAIDRTQQVNVMLGYSVRYLTIGAFLFLFAVELVGAPVISALLGDRFLPVVDNLRLLAVGLLPIGLIRTGMSLTILRKSARSLVPITGTALIVFLISATLLVPLLDGRGASLAVALALWSAGLVSVIRLDLGPALSIARFGRLAACGFPVLAIVLWPTPVVVNAAAIALYLGLLFAVQVITPSEVRRLARTFLRRRSGEAT